MANGLLLILASCLFVATWASHIEPLKACSCVHDDCGCCEHLEWKAIHLNDTACLNITYFPASLTISLSLTFGRRAARFFLSSLSHRCSP